MLSKLVARWLLPASLALNVFFAVVVFMHYQHFHAGPPDPMHVADRMAADLSPLDGAILQQAFTSRAPAMTEARRRMADFSEQMRDTLEAAPFDPDRLKAVLENGRAVREGLDMVTASAFVEAASKISPEGRKALASRPAPPPGSRPPPRPGFGPPPGPPPGFASPSLLDPGPPPPR